MSFKGWTKVKIKTDYGEEVVAKAPVIISASRSTDIPAYYSEWFFNRLRKRHLKWTNPFNGHPQYISLQNTRVIVFWSKNPAPILPYLKLLNELGIHYYFLYTLNDYEKENLEPNVPPIRERIDTFRELSQIIGKEKVIWRYDPLVLTSNLDPDQLLNRVEKIGHQIHRFTEKLVFSFVQINPYRKVKTKLLNKSQLFHQTNLQSSEFTGEQKLEFGKKLSNLNTHWNLSLASCAEDIDLEKYGIVHNKCIDDDLMKRLFCRDKKLMHFLHTGEWEQVHQRNILQETGGRKFSMKDKGQRQACGCVYSKDIGMYNTCPHLCLYCYANTSDKRVKNNACRHDPSKERII